MIYILLKINLNKIYDIYIIMTFIYFFNQIKQTVPKCMDCKYYLTQNHPENQIFGLATSKCRKFLSANTDGMGTEYEYAYIVRSEKVMCGPRGRYFQPLNKTK
jgi:hypothetical protein